MQSLKIFFQAVPIVRLLSYQIQWESVAHVASSISTTAQLCLYVVVVGEMALF